MASKLDPATRQEYLTKTFLITVFISLFIGFVIWQRENIFELTPFDFVLLGLATLRLGRLIAFDVVSQPLRMPFTQTVPDETGAGDTVEPRGSGARRAIGQLISCPICAGTWVSAFLTYGLFTIPQPTRIFLTMTAAISLAELLNAIIEAFCWNADLARNRTGSYILARRSQSTLAKTLPAVDCPEEEYPEPLPSPSKRIKS